MIDKSMANVLWLYPENTEGIIFNMTGKKSLNDNLSTLFDIKLENKPIPILVDKNLANQFLFKKVKITGIISTSPLQYFTQFSSDANSFFLDYYSICFRPLSSQDGVLAIDALSPNGK